MVRKMPEEKKLTLVDEKSLALVKQSLKDIVDLEDIDNVIEYTNIGAIFFKSLHKLSVLIKEGAELTQIFKEKLKEAEDVPEKTEVLQAAFNDLGALMARFITVTDEHAST